MRRVGILLLVLSACGGPVFSPPNHPVHGWDEEGPAHGLRYERPFNCGTDERDEKGFDCRQLTARPGDEQLSCDAAGCHGSYDYRANSSAVRHLRGSDGPSCYTCHGEEWKDDD